jgi:membrane associated rhomboid family serine protease
MAFRSNGPISLVFPPFRGVTRRIILTALIVFFGVAAMGLFSRELAGTVNYLLLLLSDKTLHPLIFQLVTYPFAGDGVIGLAFALLSFWFFGSALEEERGPLWMTEYFFVSTIGGALAGLLMYAAGQGHIPGFAGRTATGGMWPAVLAILVAYGNFHAEEQVNFNFFFTVKAKYLAAIYVLFYLAMALGSGDRFGALVALCNALAGYVFLKVAPKYGFRVGVSERWYAMRNLYYRSKRKRAAKKFKVYMRKHGEDVRVDENGHYVDPEGKPRDPNDKRWMN